MISKHEISTKNPSSVGYKHIKTKNVQKETFEKVICQTYWKRLNLIDFWLHKSKFFWRSGQALFHSISLVKNLVQRGLKIQLLLKKNRKMLPNLLEKLFFWKTMRRRETFWIVKQYLLILYLKKSKRKHFLAVWIFEWQRLSGQCIHIPLCKALHTIYIWIKLLLCFVDFKSKSITSFFNNNSNLFDKFCLMTFFPQNR